MNVRPSGSDTGHRDRRLALRLLDFLLPWAAAAAPSTSRPKTGPRAEATTPRRAMRLQRIAGIAAGCLALIVMLRLTPGSGSLPLNVMLVLLFALLHVANGPIGRWTLFLLALLQLPRRDRSWVLPGDETAVRNPKERRLNAGRAKVRPLLAFQKSGAVPRPLLRAGVLVMSGLVSSICAGVFVTMIADTALTPAARATVGESLALPASILAGVIVGTIGIFAFVRLPRMLATARLSGRLSVPASDRIANVALAWVLLLPAAVLGQGIVFTSMMEVIAVYASAGTSLLMEAIVATRRNIHGVKGSRLWIIVDAAANQPIDRPMAIAAALHQRWTAGPMTLVIPADLELAGEHLLLAASAGHAGLLFPKADIELLDWHRSMPRDEAWECLPVRELHVRRERRFEAVAMLVDMKHEGGDRGGRDMVVLVTEDVDAVNRMPNVPSFASRVVIWLGFGSSPLTPERTIRLIKVYNKPGGAEIAADAVMGIAATERPSASTTNGGTRA